MGFWIGTGMIFLGAILILLQLLFLSIKRFNKTLYTIHVAVTCVVYVMGAIACVLFIDLEGVWWVMYALVMLSFAVFVCCGQVKTYDNVLKNQEAKKE